ncbi:MAG: hypothetical protein ACW99Q_22625, partial [Candidatus Kariarchaeaceae archaeon]
NNRGFHISTLGNQMAVTSRRTSKKYIPTMSTLNRLDLLTYNKLLYEVRCLFYKSRITVFILDSTVSNRD